MRQKLPHVVGLAEAQACRQIELAGYIARIVRVDGTARMRNSDARGDRLNLLMENGIVTDAYIG